MLLISAYTLLLIYGSMLSMFDITRAPIAGVGAANSISRLRSVYRRLYVGIMSNREIKSGTIEEGSLEGRMSTMMTPLTLCDA